LEKYQEMGFDKINFGFDKATVPIYLKNDPEFKNHLSACIQDKMRFADKKNIDHLRLEQLGFLG
jgi:hypothetical protein